MSKIKSFMLRLGRLWYLKYVVVLALGVLFVGFLDDNSLWAHLRNKDRIGELNAEIEQYDQAYRRDQAQIRELQHNPKAIERIARERYFMKAADEDIFVLSDDGAQPTTNNGNDEATE